MHVLNIIELSLRTQRELIVGKLANNVSVWRLMLFYFHLLLLLQRLVLFMMQSYLQGRKILREFDVTWIRPRLGGLSHLETFTWQILTPAEEGYPFWQAGQPASSGHPTYRNKNEMKDYMDGRVTPPKWITSPTWGSPLPCKQARLSFCLKKSLAVFTARVYVQLV